MTPLSADRTRLGLLHLHFEERRGRTVLTRDVQKAPLMIVRPFELPCGSLMVFIVNPTGGVLGGDHAEVRVTVGGGARAVVLTQAATRVQPSPDGRPATQDVRFEIADGGLLEYHPERTIPFAGSDFRQTVRVDVRGGGHFGMTETLAAGRVARGERLAFRAYHSRVEVRRDGRPAALDVLCVTPGAPLSAPGVLGGADYVASGVYLSPTPPPADLPAREGVLACGPNHAGAVWLRGTSASGPVLDAALRGARDHLRAALFGLGPLRVRR